MEENSKQYFNLLNVESVLSQMTVQRKIKSILFFK